MAETNLLKRAMLAVSPRTVLFRNNTALAWVGNVVEQIRERRAVVVNPGDVVIRGARPLHAGLVKGGHDLIGWTRVEVKPAHVGRTHAVFTGLEGKTGKAQPTAEQKNFRDQVILSGGISGVFYDPEEARRIVDAF